MLFRMRACRWLFAGVFSLSGCAAFEQILAQPGGINPPTIKFREAKLSHSPSQHDLAAYYCPRLMREKGGIAAMAADFTCGQFFGPAPRTEDISIGFDVRLSVANPNQVPLPLSSLLTAVTVFPQSTEQRLGALCVRMCPPDDGACRGGADPEACEDKASDIRTMKDFPHAVVNMLVAQGLRGAAGEAMHFTLPAVLENSSVDVVTRFSFLPEALIPLFEELARQSVEKLKAGQDITFSLPYKLQGTIFAEAGSLGRVAAGYGPISGEWVVPVARLLP